ncbi:aminopeptidase P N-terminal domain-containing protein [Pontibacter sp. KCTC 32443]|uniref:aminopeptidase P N-terminal domain-containing protein n=1 Tax=Pontibacter TaxID=323449 RepID=UPI00164D43C9|nr:MULTISPECIES: aminopeptidase P N-terminal domain-containing protein [Pontibacter]MBC5774390.1 aminopeptidase P N-terminal domain-containing protein [Pontibacter sp. KCTC 32443]
MAAIRLCVLLVWATITAATAQSRVSPDKPSDTLDKEFHRQRREQLRKQLPARSVAVFFAAPVRNRSNDVDHYYHQDPDFYYLTGYTEPNAVLIVYAEPQTINGKQVKELLFVQPNNAQAELWNGKRLGVEGSAATLGITTQPNTAFKSYLDKADLQQVYIKPLPTDVRDDERDNADLYSLVEQFRAKNVKADEKALEIVMGQMREEKTPEEINLLRKAVTISALGQIEVMKAMQPNMSELEVQGLHEFVHNKYGAHHVGYPSIVGAGNNGCVLHYIESGKPSISNNELVLMDVGAEYKGYTADVTRTIPANGKFSPEQKAIYELVLKAQDAGIEQCKVGNDFSAPGQAAQEVIAEGLVKLGIIKNKSEARRYFPHGTSHYIGLDVHDAGTYGPFKANSVITVEPGIYIPDGSPCDKKWWGIGIRIEDDILITDKGWENLSKLAPRTVADIEKAMAQPSALDDFKLPEIK